MTLLFQIMLLLQIVSSEWTLDFCQLINVVDIGMFLEVVGACLALAVFIDCRTVLLVIVTITAITFWVTDVFVVSILAFSAHCHLVVNGLLHPVLSSCFHTTVTFNHLELLCVSLDLDNIPADLEHFICQKLVLLIGLACVDFHLFPLIEYLLRDTETNGR